MFFTILFGCQKGNIVDPVDPIGIDSCLVFGCDSLISKLKIIGQVPLQKESLNCSSNVPLITNSGILFSQRYCNSKEVLIMIDPDFEKVLWEWSGQENGNAADVLGLFYLNGNIIYDNWNRVYSINSSTGSTQWQYSAAPNCGSPRSVQLWEYLYDIYETCGTVNQFSTLMRMSINTGIPIDICTLEMRDGYSPDIEPPGLWAKPNGDTR